VADDPLGDVLDLLRRPYRAVTLLELLLGLSHRTATEIAGVTLATSPEAGRLLAGMPSVLRSLALAPTDALERCHGELRGPIRWSETMSARASSAGDHSLFICATPIRAYDNDANRVLVAALETTRTAGRARRARRGPSPALRVARANAESATRFLHHRTLADVPRIRPDERARRRAGRSRRRTYRPALDLLARSDDLLAGDVLSAVADDASRAGAALLLRVLGVAGSVAVERGDDPPELRLHVDALVAGPVSFRRRAGLAEVSVGGVAVSATASDAALTAAIRLATGG
jgi:hypothetical protein